MYGIMWQFYAKDIQVRVSTPSRSLYIFTEGCGELAPEGA